MLAERGWGREEGPAPEGQSLAQQRYFRSIKGGAGGHDGRERSLRLGRKLAI